jgi:hypothetical protein
MKLNIAIDPSQTTEDECIVSNVEYRFGQAPAKAVNKITVLNMCTKFAEKALVVLKSLASKKRFFYSYQIAVLNSNDKSDQNISVHVIKNREGATVLFDTLRRIGIVISELKIGLSGDKKKLYLSNKILKDLSKFSSDMQQEIVKYLVSVAFLFDGIATNTPTLECSFGATLTTNIAEWAHYIFSFNGITSIEVDEIPTSDLKAIRYCLNVYSTPSIVTGIYPANDFSIIESNTDRYIVLSRSLEQNNFWVVCNKNNHTVVYTNTSLTYLDMDYDMWASGFAQATHSTVDVMYVKDFTKLLKDEEYTISVDIAPDIYETDEAFNKIVEFYKSNPGIAKSKITKIVPKCKSGGGMVDAEAMKAQYTEDEYAQQLYTQVQSHYEDFDLKALNNSLRGFANGDIYAMMFIGESGTGKSTAARVIPYKCGIPYVSINFCVNIEESDLVGTMIPNPEKSKPEDPEFIWQDGILTKAVRYGYTAVLEEINFARPGVLGKLNSLLDENRQIDLPNGEILKAHPNFRMIATCNIAYEGTNRFNKALINRFEIIHEFKELEKTDAFKVLRTRIPTIDDIKMNKIYSVYELLKKYTTEQSIDVVVSIRQLLNVFKQGKYYQSAYDAILDILINGAFIELPEYKDKFVEVLNQMKKDYMFKI